MKRREEEYLLQQRLLADLRRNQISRRQFMTRMLAAGLGLTGVSAALSACTGVAVPTNTQQQAQQAETSGETAAEAPAGPAASRPLTPTFYQWIEDLHPSIPQVNSNFPEVNYQIAPVEGFGIERFVAEAKNQESTWDVYVGMTPFVEMSQLIEADVIEPWDNYIPKEVIDDMIPSIREECTVDGKLYSWPFLLDVITMGWNSEMTDQAGVSGVPTTWDEYLAYSQQVVDSGAALYGCTFDAHGWRSLAPFTHSLSTDVYTDEGLFDFTHEAAIEALLLMEKMMALSHPDILLEGATDGGVNGTPDEVAFAAQKVAYYCKYQNAPLRMAANWPDPTKLGLAALPKFEGGEGATVFWTTGSCLFKHGQNKEKAAEYIRALTYDPQIWRDSIEGTETAHPGQLPPYKSIYNEWDTNKPEWLPPFVGLVRSQLDVARAITNHLFGLSQFQIGKAHWEKYLKGEEADPKAALQAAKDAVQAEIDKS
jgi:ABC-type glycerol-3-phosphate transport system substrate-binding protein